MKSMRVKPLLFLLVLLGAATAANAQVGIYGKFDYVHYSVDSNSTGYVGGGVGVYDDFLHAGPLSLGLDLRGDLTSESNSNYRTLLVGVRVAGRVPITGLRPYVQGSIGVGGTEAKGPFAVGITGVSYNNKLTYEGIAGVDFRILPHVDFRAVEFALGKQSKLDNSAPTIFSLSSGLVVRF